MFFFLVDDPGTSGDSAFLGDEILLSGDAPDFLPMMNFLSSRLSTFRPPGFVVKKSRMVWIPGGCVYSQ